MAWLASSAEFIRHPHPAVISVRGALNSIRAQFSIKADWLKCLWMFAFWTSLGITILLLWHKTPSVVSAGIMGMAAYCVQRFFVCAMRLSFSVAFSATAVWLVHPLLRPCWISNQPFGDVVLVLILPMMLAALTIGDGRSRFFPVAVAAIVCGLYSSSNITAFLISVIAGAISLTVTENPCVQISSRRRTNRWTTPCVLISVTLAASLARSLLSTDAFPGPFEMESMSPESPGPLAFVDRQGHFAALAPQLPRDLVMGGRVWYVGMTVLGLGLFVLWPGTQLGRDPKRIAAVIATAYFAIVWLCLGQESPHTQIVTLFEQATVRKHLSVAALQWLGIEVVALLAWACLSFLALIELTSPRRAWSLGSVVISVLIMMGGWMTSPASLGMDIQQMSTILRSSVVIHSALFLLLIAVAAGGIQGVVNSQSSRTGRFLTVVVCAAIVAVDYSELHLYLLR